MLDWVGVDWENIMGSLRIVGAVNNLGNKYRQDKRHERRSNWMKLYYIFPSNVLTNLLQMNMNCVVC